MITPDWALTLAYWLHMLATVVWLGGLSALGLMVLPAARRSLNPQEYSNLLDGLQKRLEQVGWFSLAILTATGLVQMSANANYQGFLAIDNRWSAAILVKHLVFMGMIGISAYLTWSVFPALRRIAMRKNQLVDPHGNVDSSGALQRKETLLIRLNLILGGLILLLTAVARAA